eukprot:TRINITY_DN160_c0_g1_i8.p1 TRINITY_DN160_c0_g1~~TRINITY_DN160_c0_g1_i8.p1  ORF type:complete len:157 (+),score=53.85 TRINITY_DN160_c0_g1_i8:69-473(+)
MDKMSMPFMGLPNDAMRYGIKSLKHDASPNHPLETSLKKFDEEQLRLKYVTLSNIYGSHMPIRLEMEKHIVTKNSLRLAPLQSSNLGLDVLTRHDEDFGFEDFLCDARFSERAPVDLHTAMEKKFGIETSKMRF